MRTLIGVNDPKAIKKQSAFLAVDMAKKSYITSRLMGVGQDSSMPCQMLKELESDAGEYISFDLLMQMTMQPREGDQVLENFEEDMKFYTDGLYIDQLRAGVNTGGRMTRKRTIHALRARARRLQRDYWARVFDELWFMYASGARGINTGFLFPLTYTGFAGNAFTAPDAEHIQFAGGTKKATLADTNKFEVGEIDKAVAVISDMGGDAGSGYAGTDGNLQTPGMLPIMVDGEEHYVVVVHPYSTYDMRTATGTNGWMDIQKAAIQALGRKSPIFTGAKGMHNNVLIHEHRNVIRFNDYGAGGNVAAARSLLLGEQATVIAFGSPGTGLRFGWHEEGRDNDNQLVISTHTIVGMKKVSYNGKDLATYAIDCACKRPVTTAP
jgi:N4-gp56 family major capsid protein